MNYHQEYMLKRTSTMGVVDEIKNGWVCCTDIGASIPVGILNSLGEKIKKCREPSIQLHTMLEMIPMKNLLYSEQVSDISWFLGSHSRKAANSGAMDIMPCCYRDMPNLLRDYIELDVFLTTVSPMDENGYFTTGVTASSSVAMIEKSKKIFLEVNENMPRVPSAPKIHISQVDALCENNVPLPNYIPDKPDEINLKIGKLIADEIEDGSTIQLGIGAISRAVISQLYNKKNLGIHTELLTDGMVDLIKAGVVTNEYKPIHQGKTVATLALGTKALYEYLNENDKIEMLSVDYVNSPSVIAKHPNFVSINSALEVDFMGQVCAESIGTMNISGTGGQADYVRGAINSPNGKSFIAFPSTAQDGKVSRIRSILTPGAVVTTSKNLVDCIVTEYGIAKLRGKTLAQRTKALIDIAHPKFRKELFEEACKRNILL